MNEIVIRPAKLEDLEILLEFEQGVIATERPFDNTLRDGVIHYYDLAQMILSTDVFVVAALSGNKIVGSGYARIKKSMEYLKHLEYAYLGFMFVLPQYRGKGINSMILDALKHWAQSKNLDELRLDVYPENYPAVRAYEKAGFSSYLVNMRMSLKDEQKASLPQADKTQ